MDLFHSPYAPFIIIALIFGVLAGFFKHLLVKVIVILLIEVALFILFPDLLVKLAELVSVVRRALG